MSTTTARENIGFIGLGLMGHGIAKNIVDKGYPLTFLGRKNRKPAEDLLGRGAKEAATSARCGGGIRHRLHLRHRLARGRSHHPRPRRPQGRPEEGLGRRRLLDLRSRLDRGARRRTEGARHRLCRRAAEPHAEGSLGRHARRHGRRARRTLCPGQAGDRNLGRAHRPYRRHRRRPPHEAAQQFHLAGLCRALFRGAGAGAKRSASRRRASTASSATAAWIAASTRPSCAGRWKATATPTNSPSPTPSRT